MYILPLVLMGFCSCVKGYSQNQIPGQAAAVDTINLGSIDHDDKGYTREGFVNPHNQP